jgi:hypothetical protein
MMQVIQKACERDLQQWDLCGADYESIARFKASLGGKLTGYYELIGPRSLAAKVFKGIKKAFSE